jgi:hypothetical protein
LGMKPKTLQSGLQLPITSVTLAGFSTPSI